MLEAVIIDDEKHCSEGLYLQIQSLQIDMSIKERFNDPALAIKYLETQEVDIVFLDIEMPHINGFELLHKLPNLSAKVVFTTAYDEFAIRAFKVSAFDYLLKPIQDDELLDVIQRIKKAKLNDQSEKVKMILEFYKSNGKNQTKVAFPTSDGYEFIDVNTISHCMADSNYTKITFKDGRQQLISRTLKEVDAVLINMGFLRVHQSYLINPDFIAKVSRNDGGLVIMVGGAEVPVSKQKREQILQQVKIVQRI
jgi:two-component system LytT family response regulator